MMGKEAQVVIATLSQFMAAKIDEPILHIKGWVNGWILIAVARSFSRLLRISQVLSPLRIREPD